MRVITFILLFLVSFVLKAQHDHAGMSSTQPPYKIIIFMAVDCPITQKYMGTIKELARKYQSQQISVVGYFPAGLSKKGEKEFRQEYQVPEIIQFIDDKKHVMTNKYGATITPEVILIDKNQQVIYQGSIDNWFFELGRYRLEITEHYLIDAIDASLKGNQTSIKKTEAIGCFIQGTAVNNKTEHHKH
jgi:thiol-disulfide isomerase/thioredoxin